MRAFLGIDVGTGSARAGLFDESGRMLGSASREIRIWRPADDFVEQSSDDIWRACGEATRSALAEAGLAPADVAGVGFDATCSLVALDADDRPVSVSPTGRDEQNVIVWMDHRAIGEAERINAGGHDVLRYVGGVISPEMQTPKLLWLRENASDCWSRAARFLDLPDFLTFRATGVDVRSLCTTVCKWTYLGKEERWDRDYFRAIGLGDLVDEDFARIGTRVRPMGEPIGAGLTAEAAAELGLAPGTPVGVAIIDAHAGGLGMLSMPVDGGPPDEHDLNRRLALICGTSSCHMAVSQEPRFLDGIWGPYYSAMVPGLWLTEGGQSATGSLVDHVIHGHPRAPELVARAPREGRSIYELLNDHLARLAGGSPIAHLARDLHVLPYFHGNRSPRAEPRLRGMISGLELTDSLDSLALLYLATIQAIAHGTRHIVDAMNAGGYAIDTLIACGGDTKNPVFVQEHASATGCRIVLPREPEAVLLGAAILGAVACGAYPSVLAAMSALSAPGTTVAPAAGETARYHARKHEVFLRMYDDQKAYESIMRAAPSVDEDSPRRT